MDLLSITNQINVELSSIHANHGNVLSDRDRLTIFNSVVTVLADDLVDILRFNLHSEGSQGQPVATWDYDFRNRDYPRRIGPTLPELLGILKLASYQTRLGCEARWSRKFTALDPVSQDRVLLGTVWAEQIPEQSVTASRKNTDNQPASNGEQLALPWAEVSLQPIEFELLKLAAETAALSATMVRDILKSLNKLLECGLAQGIHLAIVGRDREEQLLQWRFELSAEQQWRRVGSSLEQALRMLKEFKNQCELRTNPIPSTQFLQLPTASQQETLQDTYWGHKSQTGKRSWFRQ